MSVIDPNPYKTARNLDELGRYKARLLAAGRVARPFQLAGASFGVAGFITELLAVLKRGVGNQAFPVGLGLIALGAFFTGLGIQRMTAYLRNHPVSE